MKTHWSVKQTPCYPNSFKVAMDNRPDWPESNATHLYHPTQEAAQKQADEFNAREVES